MTIDFDRLTPTTRYVIERAAQILAAEVRAEIDAAAVATALGQDAA